MNTKPWTEKWLKELPPHEHEAPSKAKELSHPAVKGLKLEITKAGTKTFWIGGAFRDSKVKNGNKESRK